MLAILLSWPSTAPQHFIPRLSIMRDHLLNLALRKKLITQLVTLIGILIGILLVLVFVCIPCLCTY